MSAAEIAILAAAASLWSGEKLEWFKPAIGLFILASRTLT